MIFKDENLKIGKELEISLFEDSQLIDFENMLSIQIRNHQDGTADFYLLDNDKIDELIHAIKNIQQIIIAKEDLKSERV